MLTQIVIGLEAAAGNAARKRDVSLTIKDNYALLKFHSILNANASSMSSSRSFRARHAAKNVGGGTNPIR